MKQITKESEATHLRVTAYGHTGSGKSRLGTTAPKPLHVVTERQAIPIIRAATKGGEPAIVLCETAEDLRRVAVALMAPKGTPEGFTVTDRTGGILVQFKGWWPETIVLDSTTDMAKMLADEIQKMGKQGDVDKDGMPKRKDPYGNLLFERFDAFIRTVRDSAYHALFLAEREDREVKEGEQVLGTETGPAFPLRKLGKRVAHASNLVCITFRQEKKSNGKVTGYEWGVRTMAGDNVLVKPLEGLRELERPDFTAWINAFTKGIPTPEGLTAEGAAS